MCLLKERKGGILNTKDTEHPASKITQTNAAINERLFGDIAEVYSIVRIYQMNVQQIVVLPIAPLSSKQTRQLQ